jgi:X-Pro dipeptidyl-peptidase
VLRPRAGGGEIGALAVGTSAPEVIGQDASKPVLETLVDDVAKSGTALARAAKSPHRLLYALPPLATPLHLSGTAKLNIRVACDKPAANLSVWLVALAQQGAGDESGDGDENGGKNGGKNPGKKRSPKIDIITRGWADPRNHASLEKQEPLEPGRFYDLSFELEPDDQVIAAGKRIALMIFSSDRDFTLWPKAGTKLTVDLGGTSLELPVVGGADALSAAIAAKTE